MKKKEIGKAVNDLQSEDYIIASKAIDKLKIINAKEELKKGLKSKQLFVRHKIWTSISDDLDDKDIPELIKLLELEKTPIEGSETATIQKKLKRELVSKLKELTKEKLILKNVDDEIEMEEIIINCKRWCDKKHDSLK